MTKKWAKHRDRIVSLYLDDNKPLHQVQAIMEQQQNFTASTRAYRHRFMKWGLFKYSPQRRRTSTSSAGSSGDVPETARPAVPLWPSASYAHAGPASPLFSSPEIAGFARVCSPENVDTTIENSTTLPPSPDRLDMYSDQPPVNVTGYPPSPPRGAWLASPAPAYQQQCGVSCVLPPIRAAQWGECCCQGCMFPSSSAAAALPGFWEVTARDAGLGGDVVDGLDGHGGVVGSLACGLAEQYVDGVVCYPRV